MIRDQPAQEERPNRPHLSSERGKRERHMLKQNENITGLEKGHEEGLFPNSGHTRINGTSVPEHQAEILKQAEEGVFSHSS